MASIAKRPSGIWRARYRDSAGREHSRHFARKTDAQRWLDETTASIVTGAYVAPGAGRVTFREYSEEWRKVQVHRPGTATVVEGVLTRHVYPVIGDRPLESIRPSDVQAMVKGMTLAPSTVRVAMRYVSGIFKAAVLDRRIPVSPCQGVRLPKGEARRIEVVSTESVVAMVAAVPEAMRAMLILGAGTGMRQGEIFGLTVDRVDFLRRTVRVDRQIVDGGVFGPPKTASSVRTIPLPQTVVDALAAHLQRFPTGETGLVFTRPSGAPWKRSAFSERWIKARRAAGVPSTLTMHSLRHYYASLLIRHGESVKVVQSRLGHATAAETLDTYSHLWPDSEDRTREAVDLALGYVADPLRTTPGL
ncbi:tyrosine-type recombinase/integrase [Ornithinimicrobium sediminis]|uniref:tyrosine-type recombinase/integrase n=1 Tax=Ornithinimicrobium sediminis TaxID=2904603 RepID=UPI001E438DD1|nr:site-specific integrase [Ornithinimicrobium sediminis]MCE0488122.1 site-specific integrase [Ornithinimicrobium sediminis]